MSNHDWRRKAGVAAGIILLAALAAVALVLSGSPAGEAGQPDMGVQAAGGAMQPGSGSQPPGDPALPAGAGSGQAISPGDAAVMAADRANPKLASSLTELSLSYQAGGAQGAADYASGHGMQLDGSQVTVVLEGADGPDAASQTAETAGGKVQTTYRNLVQASVPVDKLTEISQSSSVSYVREPERPAVFATTDEGVADTGASAWQAAGDTGAGVKVAIVDPGFAGYTDRIAGGDLPANVITRSFRSDGDITGGGQDHGTACSEIVYDMAPGAQLYLVNFSTDVELGNAVDWLISQNVNVISGSFGFFGSFAGNGTGSVDSITQQASAAGIFWANASGNAAVTHWSGPWTDNGSGWEVFSGTDTSDQVNGYAGQPIDIYLTWDKWPTTDQDYDLYLYNPQGTLVADSVGAQTGTQEPAEEIHYLAAQTGTYYIRVNKYSANGVANFHLYTYPYQLHYYVQAGSLGGQPTDSPYVMTAGAVPVGGTGIEYYSSRGPTNDGRIKPDIVGPDWVSTATYGYQNFGGTSAAAPHVAGAAALVKYANPSWTAADIQSFLENRATDLGAPGKDSVYGSGKLNLGAAPAMPDQKTYYFTWYDEKIAGMSNWILIGNPNPTESMASVYIGDRLMATYQIPANGRVTPDYPGMQDGPVRVVSTTGTPLLVTQRVLYNNTFTELPAVPSPSASSDNYMTWYDEQSPGLATWILISNQGTAPTTAQVLVHGNPIGTYDIPVGGRVTPDYPGLMDGPVEVRSIDEQPLVVSERVIYRGGFNEVTATPAGQLSSSYSFPWYGGQNMSSWVLAANPDPVNSATVDIYISGGQHQVATLPPGGIWTPAFSGLNDYGPVTVTSTGGQPLIVSERSLYGNSFEEVAGVPDSALSPDAYFTWYDQQTPGISTTLLLSNKGSLDTQATVSINGVPYGNYSLPAGGSVLPVSYPGVINGPVQIVSNNSQPLCVSERTYYLSSFNEIMGIVLQ